jgi:phosphatidylserine/phosphatidylglycerophosphate/cardiolipin synthase-like enzyme
VSPIRSAHLAIKAQLAWVLITSANFTDRGQSRNLELGVVLRDGLFGAAVTEKLRRLQVLGRMAT